jgi:hypothetical protein
VFERLAALDDPRLVVIAAGRTRELELPGHWTAPLRRSRAAVILRPLAGDGAMFGLHLRVSSSHPAVGRGLLIDDDRTTPVLLGTSAEATQNTFASAVAAEATRPPQNRRTASAPEETAQ